MARRGGSGGGLGQQQVIEYALGGVRADQFVACQQGQGRDGDGDLAEEVWAGDDQAT